VVAAATFALIVGILHRKLSIRRSMTQRCRRSLLILMPHLPLLRRLRNPLRLHMPSRRLRIPLTILLRLLLTPLHIIITRLLLLLLLTSICRSQHGTPLTQVVTIVAIIIILTLPRKIILPSLLVLIMLLLFTLLQFLLNILLVRLHNLDACEFT